MSRFDRPNPDAWLPTETIWEQSYKSGTLSIELWESGDDASDEVWVLVCDPGGHGGTSEHTVLTDAMAAMMLRVMGGDETADGSLDRINEIANAAIDRGPETQSEAVSAMRDALRKIELISDE